MSTKTSIKRVALVAVSALGFGLMSVVPASADEDTATKVTTYAPIARVNATASIVTKVDFETDSFDVDDEVWLAARFTADGRPAGSALTNLSLSFELTSFSGVDTLASETNTGYSTSYKVDSTAANSEVAYVKAVFTPDVVGTYTVLVWNDANHDGIYQSSEKSSTATVTTAGKPTLITLTNVGGATVEDSEGALVKVTLTDAAAKATVLAPGELLALTENGSGTFKSWDGSTTITELTDADFTRSGVAWMYVSSTAPETLVATVKGDGDLASTLSATLSIIFRQTDVEGDDADIDIAFDGTDGTDGWTGDDISLAAQTVTFLATLNTSADVHEADQYAGAQVTDLAGHIAGTSPEAYTNGGNVASGSYTLKFVKAVTIAADKDEATFTLAFLASAAAVENVVAIADEAAAGTGIAGVDRVAAVASTFDAGTTSQLSLTGGSVSLSGTLYDQFGNALANYPVTMSFSSGRNAGRTAIPAITNADGAATFTYTDAAITATSTSDTLDFDSGSTEVSGDVTITYTTVSTGTLTVDASTTQNAINTDSAKAATVTLTFTALDSNSAPIVGLAIVVAGTSTGASVSTGNSTVYTGSNGKATASVFSSKTGAMTWTGTASMINKTATATRTFVNATGDAKVLAATATTTAITATVTDNYGNPVKGVTVDFSRTGTVSFGGLASISAKTNTSGVAEVLFSGAGTVTASLVEADYPKSAWIAGYLGKTSTATASTAAVAGVGSASVTVSGDATPAEAATDAALEAIDAANAAVDAANQATEAADAATVAAEEARDAADAATAAVEALSTEVAKMINEIKAQLKAMAKTIARIAKRVK